LSSARCRTRASAHEAVPFGDDCPERRLVGGAVGVGQERQPFGVEGELREPPVRALQLLTVLMPLGRAAACVVEPRAQRGVLALLRRCARHAFPFGARSVELRRRVVSAQRVDARADGLEGQAALGGTLGFGDPLGFGARVRLHRGAGGGDLVGEPGGQLLVGLRAESLPLRFRLVELHACVRRRRRSRHRLDAGDQERDAPQPVFVRRLAGGLGLFDLLKQRLRALRDELVLRARRHALEQFPSARLG
jgi:hypothetical protein